MQCIPRLQNIAAKWIYLWHCAGDGTPIVLLLFNAGPLDITWAKYSSRVLAIVECFFPAQATGTAVYQMLTASGGTQSVPAARLPATWPASLSQVIVIIIIIMGRMPIWHI